MSSVRCQMSISLDGYVARPDQGPHTFVPAGDRGGAQTVEVVASPTVTHIRYRVVR